MWGEDVSLNPSSNSQYIELYNPGGQLCNSGRCGCDTPDVNEALTLVFYAPNEFVLSRQETAVAATADCSGNDWHCQEGVTDRIGTLDAKGAIGRPQAKVKAVGQVLTAGTMQRNVVILCL